MSLRCPPVFGQYSFSLLSLPVAQNTPSQISMSNISFRSAGMGVRGYTVTLRFRRLKQGLEKSSENQDNGVCEKSAEDYCGNHIKE